MSIHEKAMAKAWRIRSIAVDLKERGADDAAIKSALKDARVVGINVGELIAAKRDRELVKALAPWLVGSAEN
jgi:hypothetical protein